MKKLILLTVFLPVAISAKAATIHVDVPLMTVLTEPFMSCAISTLRNIGHSISPDDEGQDYTLAFQTAELDDFIAIGTTLMEKNTGAAISLHTAIYKKTSPAQSCGRLGISISESIDDHTSSTGRTIPGPQKGWTPAVYPL